MIPVIIAKFAIGTGFGCAIADSLSQLLWNQFYSYRNEKKELQRWNTGRSLTVFAVSTIVGAVAGGVFMAPDYSLSAIAEQMGFTLGTLTPMYCMIFIPPTRAWHIARHLPGYIVVLIGIYISLGFPLQILKETGSELAKRLVWESRLITFGLVVPAMFVFVNRYPTRQRKHAVPDTFAPIVRLGNNVAIFAGQIAGNAMVASFTFFFLWRVEQQMQYAALVPAVVYQTLVNINMQVFEQDSVPAGVKMLRIAAPLLAIPASVASVSMGDWQTYFNILAVSSYAIWIGSYFDEYQDLYDETEVNGVEGKNRQYLISSQSFVLDPFIKKKRNSNSDGDIKESLSFEEKLEPNSIFSTT